MINQTIRHSFITSDYFKTFNLAKLKSSHCSSQKERQKARQRQEERYWKEEESKRKGKIHDHFGSNLVESSYIYLTEIVFQTYLTCEPYIFSDLLIPLKQDASQKTRFTPLLYSYKEIFFQKLQWSSRLALFFCIVIYTEWLKVIYILNQNFKR